MYSMCASNVAEPFFFWLQKRLHTLFFSNPFCIVLPLLSTALIFIPEIFGLLCLTLVQ